MQAPEELVSMVLNLPEEQRAALASRLLESLEPEPETSDDEWLDELERRAQRVISRESKGIPADMVYERARLSFGKK